MNGLKRSGGSGVMPPDSAESGDSGYDDYDEEYRYIQESTNAIPNRDSL
jgi:hypothetical protein